MSYYAFTYFIILSWRSEDFNKYGNAYRNPQTLFVVVKGHIFVILNIFITHSERVQFKRTSRPLCSLNIPLYVSIDAL